MRSTRVDAGGARSGKRSCEVSEVGVGVGRDVTEDDMANGERQSQGTDSSYCM